MSAALAAGRAAFLAATNAAPDDSWESRIREAAYNTPSGTRILFAYEDVGRSTPLRSKAFGVPGVNNDYVQQNGFGSRKYPLRCFFAGKSHDLIATAFEAGLLETGLATLEHPLYGKIPGVPFGEITRRDDLKTQANQTIIEVEFWTTTGAVFPAAGKHSKSEIQLALDGFNVEVAQQFDDSTDLASTINKANTRNTVEKFLRDVSATLQTAADATTEVRREFADIQRQINFGIDVLIGQPLLLARQVSNLIQAPGRALSGIQSRLEGYNNLAQSLIASAPGTPAEALASGTALLQRSEQIANDFHTTDLFAMNSVAGAITATLNNTFGTRPAALQAAQAVLDQFDAVIAWREAGFQGLETIQDLTTQQVDGGGSQQTLQEAAALTAGLLVEVSFTLVAERVIVLDRPRTLIDLAAQIYGSVDDRLDFLINSNNLTGSEILELPRGKAVRYYPDAA